MVIDFLEIIFVGVVHLVHLLEVSFTHLLHSLLSLEFYLLLLLYLLLALQFSFALALEFFELLALFLLFFLFVPGDDLGTDVFLDMLDLILELDVVLAVFALVGLAAAQVVVILPLNKLDGLVAELAGLGFHWALGLVIPVFEAHGFETTVSAAL